MILPAIFEACFICRDCPSLTLFRLSEFRRAEWVHVNQSSFQVLSSRRSSERVVWNTGHPRLYVWSALSSQQQHTNTIVVSVVFLQQSFPGENRSFSPLSLRHHVVTVGLWHRSLWHREAGTNVRVKRSQTETLRWSQRRVFSPLLPQSAAHLVLISPPPSPANFYQPPATFINFIKYSPSKLGRPF